MDVNLTIAICDDENNIHDTIKEYCNDFFGESAEIQYVDFFDGNEVIEYCKDENRKIHLLFLDIEMKTVNGLDVMNALMNESQIWRIAFVSSHTESILDTFSIKTIGFIPKPMEETRIVKVLNSVVEEYQENQTIEVIAGNRTKLIRYEDIVYLKADGSYTEVYTYAKGEVVRYTMAKKLGVIEKELNDNIFLRAHKSFIVNAEFVTGNKNEITLANIQCPIPIGRKYKNEFSNSLKKYKLMRIGRRI